MRPLPLWALIGPGLLGLLYGFLIVLALTDQSGFYKAMGMPMPNHGFMHISWTGKTVAIWAVLLIACLSRLRALVLLALAGVVIQQIGDTVAGRATGVDVFITQIGLGLSGVSLALIFLAGRQGHAREPQT